MQTADVVIGGGGMVGSSIAYQLAASGCRSLHVIEREPAQGKGSTGKSMGGVRARFSAPVSLQRSLSSIPLYPKFEANLGCPCDYRPQGYLFCTTSEQQMAYCGQITPYK
jgi:glycine/D-amino acid oxidase-like deaminating enzyme